MAARRRRMSQGVRMRPSIEKINDMNKWLSTAGMSPYSYRYTGVSQYSALARLGSFGGGGGRQHGLCLEVYDRRRYGDRAGGDVPASRMPHVRQNRTPRRGFDPAFLLWGIVLLAAVSIVVEPLSDLLPAVDRSYGRDGWIMLSAVVVAPVVEEVLFRGMLFDMIRSRAGLVAAFLLVARLRRHAPATGGYDRRAAFGYDSVLRIYKNPVDILVHTAAYDEQRSGYGAQRAAISRPDDIRAAGLVVGLFHPLCPSRWP